MIYVPRPEATRFLEHEPGRRDPDSLIEKIHSLHPGELIVDGPKARLELHNWSMSNDGKLIVAYNGVVHSGLLR